MEHVDRWATAHPAIATALQALWHGGVRTGVFSGFHAYMYAVRPHTNDLDLFTHPDDFAALQYFLPAGDFYCNKQVVMHDADGAPIQFIVDEFVTWVDDIEVQVLRPCSPVTIGNETYDLSMTDLSARHIHPVQAGGWTIGMTHLADTITAKALFQRAKGKSDLADVTGLAAYYSVVQETYLYERAAEIGFTSREFEFLGKAGIHLDVRQLMYAVA
jgi:hypothetical protein